MTKENIIQFNRKFKVWGYTVSHGQLLLRSTKDNDYPTRVDVLFKNVIFIQIPVLFLGLVVSEMDKKDFQSLNLSTGLYPERNRKFFKVSGNNWNGVIVAGVVSFLEEDAEHSSQSKLISFPVL